MALVFDVDNASVDRFLVLIVDGVVGSFFGNYFLAAVSTVIHFGVRSRC